MKMRQWLGVAIAALLNTLNGYSLAAASVAVPSIAAEWRVAPSRLSSINLACLIGMSIGSILVSPVADRVGRRPTILATLLVIGFGLIGSLVAGGVVTLWCSRLLTGIGLGVMFAATTVTAYEFADSRWRSFAIALMLLGYPAGSAAATAVGSSLLPAYGWPSIFIFGGVGAATSLLIAALFMPESREYLAVRLKSNRTPPIELSKDHVRRQTFDKALPSSRNMWKGRVDILRPAAIHRTLALTAGYFLHVLTLVFMFGYTSITLAHDGFSPSQIGDVASYCQAAGLVAAIIFGVAGFRHSAKPALLLAMCVGGFATMLFGLLPSNLYLLGAIASLAAVGLNGGMIGLNIMMATSYPAELRMTGIGFAIGFGRLGSLVSPMLADILSKHSLVGAAGASCMGLGSVLAAIIVYSLPAIDD